MGSRWAQDGSRQVRISQDGPKIGSRWPKMAKDDPGMAQHCFRIVKKAVRINRMRGDGRSMVPDRETADRERERKRKKERTK